jgi:hypothetical protein
VNYRQFEILLIDYVEGTLEEPLKKEVEQFLQRSAKARDDVSSMRAAFENLQHGSELEVPAHYFNNFLPRLRNAIDQKTSTPVRYFPQWFSRIVMPITAVVVIISMAGLYLMLQPSDSSKEMYSIVRDIDQSQYNDAVKDIALFNSDSPVIPIAEINQDPIGKEILAAAYIDDNITTDRQILSQMDETDIEYVLDRLPSVQ